jgi:hypothetical protein
MVRKARPSLRQCRPPRWRLAEPDLRGRARVGGLSLVAFSEALLCFVRVNAVLQPDDSARREFVSAPATHGQGR